MKKLSMLIILVLFAAATCNAAPVINLEHGNFDPLASPTQPGPPYERPDIEPNGKGYYIIQFHGPVLDAWKDEVKSAGAELLDYIPDFAFIVRASKGSAAKIKSLSSVRWMGDYKAEYKLSPRLPKEGKADVVIQLFPGSDTNYVEKKLTEAGGILKNKGKGQRIVHASIPTTALSKFASTAGVAWIEPKVERKLLNNIARSITTINSTWPSIGLFGAGQIVAVADTGLDNGKNDSTLSADFRGRVLKTYALSHPVTGDWSDDHGHGTHVAGTVLGSGALSGSNPSAHSYIGSFAGVAPEASLVFQSVGDKDGNLTGIPEDLNQLFSPPYSDGARVHTNSWGNINTHGVYNTDSRNTDLFTWNNKDMVIVFAAGNDGIDSSPKDGLVDIDSILSPGTAKNCITVGASESVISGGWTGTYNKYWGSFFPAEPIKSDLLSNNSSGMAAFSSRGPTDDGRIKPDICAPGTNIISCRSHDPSAITLWGTYNSHYLYCGGTSMAAPHVAGACALVREFYVSQGMNPSAALVKATLINGAFDMTPGQYASPHEIPTRRPNNVEGWGRLDIKNSIIPSSPTLLHTTDVSSGLSTNGSTDYSIYVAASTVPLRITLVWTDYPGATFATTKLVNDLDLSATGPGGVTYPIGGTTDRLNNVEMIEIPTPATGLYTINVYGYSVPHGPQPYALVMSGAITSTQPASPATVASAKELPDGSSITLTGKIVSAGSDQFNNQFYIQEPDRSSGIRVQYNTGGGPTVTVGTTVNVTGTLTTIAGERVIKDPIVSF